MAFGFFSGFSMLFTFTSCERDVHHFLISLTRPKSSKHHKSSSLHVWTHSNIVLFAVLWEPQGKHCWVWLFRARLIQNQKTQIVSFSICSWYLWVEQKHSETENWTFMYSTDLKIVTHFEESINVPHSWDEIRHKGLQFVVKLYRLWSIPKRNTHAINTSKNPWDIYNKSKECILSLFVLLFFCLE